MRNWGEGAEGYVVVEGYNGGGVTLGGGYAGVDTLGWGVRLGVGGG